ncbi:glycoside hydrolase family 3 protein [Estrella lausannensis]|uniref:glycoside hydrolase family 3 protein n=1 Tax=Estrella lausannensis TaxID=483423 RepID=UPI001303F9AC|nr:glycoside hydrolase family 3 protein [Estrella lausannensis]
MSFTFLKLMHWLALMLSANSCYGGLIDELSLEEKVGQLLMVHFYGQSANKDSDYLIQDIGVGGIVYFNWCNELKSPMQVQQLSNTLQETAKATLHGIPLFISVDQEGGPINRLKNGFTAFPSNSAVAKTKNPSLAKKAALAIGSELKAVGINMTLGPVADVNVNLENPIIGVRSFGKDPQTVALFAQEALQGYKDAGVIAVLKHFPGHGDVTVDSHQSLPVIKKSFEELSNIELYPFRELKDKTPAIMTAHLMVPCLDPSFCTTLSPLITTDLLKKHLGYSGLVMTDSLVMGALLESCPNHVEASIRAFLAGADILILGGKRFIDETGIEFNLDDIREIHEGLVEAVCQGRIPLSKINESVEKIIHLKEEYRLFSFDLPDERAIIEDVQTEASRLLAKEIAGLSLKTDGHPGSFAIPFSNATIAVFAPSIVQFDLGRTSIVNLGKKTTLFYYPTLDPTPMDVEAALQVAAESEILVLCTYNAWKYQAQLNVVKALAALKKTLIILALRDPQDISFIGDTKMVITTYSPDSNSIQTAIEMLSSKRYQCD